MSGRPYSVHYFWERVDVQDNINDCWPWTAAIFKKRGGYGAFRDADGKIQKAHRRAYELTYGRTNLDVLHKCDNPPCCNPFHLFAGTKFDNVRDMDSKGRRRVVIPKGEYHWANKLTTEQVLEIRSRTNESQRSLGREYGVSHSHIKRIWDKKIWKDI